jgi:hypothetical protein
LTLALRILLSMPFWLFRVALLLVLAALGIPIIWFLAKHGMCRPSRSSRFDRLVLQFAPFFFLWNNEEDGVDGLRGGDPAQNWWADQTVTWSSRKRIFVWSALRNPVDSLRWVPLLNPKLDPARVRFIGMDHEPAKGENGWYYAWLSGTAYSCIRIERWGFRFWVGTKLHPEDTKGLQANDVRAIRCDFAAQLKRVKK